MKLLRSSKAGPERPTAGGGMKRGLEQRFHREVALTRFLLQVPSTLVRGDAAGRRLKSQCGLNPSLDVEREPR